MKVLPILLLLLMVLPLVPAVSASDWSYSSTTSFASYFHVWAISGSVSSATPTLTFDTAKEYYEFTLTLTPASSNCTIEFTVSDCYMGCDLYVSSVLKTGDSAYTLSVPYAYNSTDVPAKDWGSGTLASPTGNMGIYKRVMLYQNGANPVTVVFRVYYATAPAVGFDGVNDYVSVNDNALLDVTTLRIESTVKFILFKAAYAAIASRDNGAADRQFLFSFMNTNDVPQLKSTIFATARKDIIAFNIDKYIKCNYTLYYDGAMQTALVNSVNKSYIAQTGNMVASAQPLLVMRYVTYDNHYVEGVWYNLSYGTYDSSPVVVINATSFSGSSVTSVTEFANGLTTTAYGNVQYKAYTGTGFQFTIPGSVFLTVEWGSYPPAGTSSPAVGSTTELVWGGSQTLYAYPMSNYEFDNFEVNGVEYTNGTTLVLYTNCTAYLNLESVDNVALAGFYTEILSFWVPFVAFAVLSFWSIRMRGNYKYFGLVFPILGLTWAFAETSYPSALFYYVSATFFIFMLLFVGFKLAGLGNRNQRKWG